MKKREPISHIMTKTVVTANENDDLKKVVEKLTKAKLIHVRYKVGKRFNLRHSQLEGLGRL